MECNSLNVLSLADLIINGLTAFATISAVIFGIIYFNKRLKIYSFRNGDFLKIVAFDKGNGNCHFEHYILNTNQIKSNLCEVSSEKYEISINLALYTHCSRLSIIIYDNYGRKYKCKYRIRNQRHEK